MGAEMSATTEWWFLWVLPMTMLLIGWSVWVWAIILEYLEDRSARQVNEGLEEPQ